MDGVTRNLNPAHITRNEEQKNQLSIIWISFFITILIVSGINVFFEMSDCLSYIWISVHICLTMIHIATLPQQVRLSVFVGFVLRIIAMIFDCTTLALSSMNGDTFRYYQYAELCMSDLSNSSKYGGLYSIILSFLFRLVGVSRPAAEYLNVLLGISIILIVFHSLKLANIKSRNTTLAVWIITVFPYSIYNSTVTYRETFIAFFSVLACYCFLCWYIKGSIIHSAISIACVLFASIFHAGVIVLIAPYMLLLLFYSKKSNRLQMRRSSVFLGIVFLALIAYIFFINPSLFLRKLMGATESGSAIVFQFNRSAGGSAYLQWLKVQSTLQAVLFSPIKAVYFWFSPLPTDWRGIVDMITFLIDGLAYFVIFKDIIGNRNESMYSILVNPMLIAFILVGLLFGIGTWNAGTAVRHRNKLFSTMLIIRMLALEKKS